MLERIREARRNESGFTLIELLIVIVILGVLAGIVVFAVNGITDTGEKASCKSDGKSVESAVEAWYAANKATVTAYPATEAAAKSAIVPKFLHSWPTSDKYTISYANTPAGSFTVTGTDSGGAACYPTAP